MLIPVSMVFMFCCIFCKHRDTIFHVLEFLHIVLPQSRLSIRRRCFTLSNTGLGGGNQDYAELGSVWKAAEVKIILWFLARKAVALASKSDVALHAHLALLVGLLLAKRFVLLDACSDSCTCRSN